MLPDIHELAEMEQESYQRSKDGRMELQERMEEEIEEAVVSYLLQDGEDCEEKLTEWFRVEPTLTSEIFGNHCFLPTDAPNEF